MSNPFIWCHKRTPDGKLGCNSCPRDFPFPATHIAHPKLNDGSADEAWPVCSSHVQYAMCAGWFPIDDLTEEFAKSAASAGEAGTAETTEIGSVHEHATREAGDAHIFNLTADRTAYVAAALELGNSALGRQTNYTLVSDIQKALESCPKGATVKIEKSNG